MSTVENSNPTYDNVWTTDVESQHDISSSQEASNHYNTYKILFTVLLSSETEKDLQFHTVFVIFPQ